MQVNLISYTKDPVKLITDVASICYGKDEAKNPEGLFKRLHVLGHLSVFEHVHFVFKIEGISRACLAQLTRHRLASYTVESQRYTVSKGDYVTPDKIKGSTFEKQYDDLIKDINIFYNYLLSKGVLREDARFILPQAMTTNLYMSLNLRQLIHIIDLRASNNAQWEINNLVNKMIEVVVAKLPELKNTLYKGDN